MLGWALNEEQNIEAYIFRAEAVLRELTDDYELILIDDGSTDRTRAIVEEHQLTRPWLKLVVNDRNRGSGYNTKRAISLATKEYLFWQTVDWSYDISMLPKVVPLLGQCDVLQGVRSDTVSLSGLLSKRSDNPYKGLVSITNYLLVRVLFQLPLSDYQNVTVYPTRLIQSTRLETDSSFSNPECLLKTWWKGATFQEFPVPFVKRRLGRSTGTRPRQIFLAIFDILKHWLQWNVLGRRIDKQRGSVRPWNPALVTPGLANLPSIPDPELVLH